MFARSALTFAAIIRQKNITVFLPIHPGRFEARLGIFGCTIEIPLFAGADLEYKLGMKLGNAVSYNWQAANLESPDELLIEFHGHTIRESEAPGDVMFYKRHRSDSASGYLVAPFDGIHGWYFDNQSNSDIVITLNVSGFYELQ